MKTIRYTLLSDGSSDKMLMPLIEWMLCQHCPEIALAPSWSDLGKLPRPPKSLREKITFALDLYPCDLLFVHRDAERESLATRRSEICRALDGLDTPPAVCIIPIRMMEAWFLFDELAIRKAAGNPFGHDPLRLPLISSLENLPDPKKNLFDLIRNSSGLSRARLRRLNVHKCAFLVSQNINNFSPLRSISAFQLFESELIETLVEHGWKDLPS